MGLIDGEGLVEPLRYLGVFSIFKQEDTKFIPQILVNI